MIVRAKVAVTASPHGTNGVVPATSAFVGAAIGSSAANGASGRDPHLGERIVLRAVQFDRGAVRLEREATLSSQLVQIVERAPTDRRGLGPFRIGHAGRDAALIQRRVVARWEAQPPIAPSRGRQPQVRVPPERHWYRPPAGGDHGGAHLQPGVACGDLHLEPVRERERRGVHVHGGAEPCGVAPGAATLDPPAGLSDEQTVASGVRCRRS